MGNKEDPQKYFKVSAKRSMIDIPEELDVYLEYQVLMWVSKNTASPDPVTCIHILFFLDSKDKKNILKLQFFVNCLPEYY